MKTRLIATASGVPDTLIGPSTWMMERSTRIDPSGGVPPARARSFGAASLPGWAAALLALALVGFVASMAQAQVAVPSLIPTAPRLTGSGGQPSAGFVTLNPAAMQWGAPSRMGVGVLESDSTSTFGNDGEFSGVFGGLRLVGERLSAAAEVTSISGSGAGGYDVESQAFALGARPFTDIVVGFSGADSEFDEPGAIVTAANKTLGLGFRFYETLYLGVAYGQDDVGFEEKASGFGVDETRDVFIYGAGYRKGGTLRLHLEVYRVERQPIEVGKLELGELNANVGVVEARLWLFAVGYRAVQTEEQDPDGTTDSDTQIFDIAFAPDSGLTIGYRYETEEATDDATGEVTETELQAVTLGWNF